MMSRFAGNGLPRVLFLLEDLRGGGAERSALELIRHLPRDAYQPMLGLMDRSGPYVAELGLGLGVDVICPTDTPFRRLLLQLPEGTGGGTLATLLRYADIIRRSGASVVVGNVAEINAMLWLVTRFWRKNPFGWVAIQRNNTWAKADALLGTGFRRRVYSQAAASGFCASDRVVAISNGLGEALVDDFGVERANVRVIPNPIDLDRIASAAAEPPPVDVSDEPPVIVAAGRLVEQKGFDLLIRAFRRVRDRAAARLLILGEGGERERLLDLARECRVGEDVVLPGFLENPWAVIKRSAVFVLSSRWEGFGRVLVEAMACGTAVVTTDCDYGPCDIVRGGRDGLLVPVEDEAALATAILQTLTDAALRDRLASQGQRRAQRYTAQRVAAEWDQLLRGIVEEPR